MTKAMLAEPCSADALLSALNDDGYSIEQKLDGHRMLASIENGVVKLFNRNGAARQKTTHPAILRTFERFPGTWMFDGEIIDSTYHVFDLLVAADQIAPGHPYEQRRAVLDAFWPQAGFDATHVALLPSYTDSADKSNLALHLRKNGGEGVIIKDLRSKYLAGSRGRAWRKFKFTNDCDCVVLERGRDGKDNLVVGLYNDTGHLLEAGTVTALAGDGATAQPGDVVCVQFLYATNDLRLYQPTRPVIRDDKAAEECTFDQLEHARCNKSVLPDLRTTA